MADMYRGKPHFMRELPQRTSLRLKERDYSAPGFYYITICTLNKIEWLSSIVNDELFLSPAGSIVQSVWDSLPSRFPGLHIDGFVVMPNHIHGIILLTEHLRYNKPELVMRPTMSRIIDAYKGAATYLIRRNAGIPEFSWQKSAHIVIVHKERALHITRRYIAKNPERWLADRFRSRGTGRGRTGL